MKSSPVDFCLPFPRLFVATEEYLDGDALAVPVTAPHLAVFTSPNALDQGDLFGQSALHQQRQSTARSRGHRVLEVLPQCTVTGAGGPQQLIIDQISLKA